MGRIKVNKGLERLMYRELRDLRRSGVRLCGYLVQPIYLEREKVKGYCSISGHVCPKPTEYENCRKYKNIGK